MDKNNKTEILAVRLTKEEKQKIFVGAHKNLKSMSEYLRSKLLDE